MPMSSRRRRGAVAERVDDAIWRGEVADADIVMTSDEHERLRADRERSARRRSLVELFGEPVGVVSVTDHSIRHRRRGAGSAGRQGMLLDQRRVAGCREEIMVTVLAHPVDAVELISEYRLLDDLGRIVVDPGSELRTDRQLSWEARLRTTPWRSRPARLRLYGSPSSNVTILTLTPRRSRRIGVRRFLSVGLSSMFELSEAIDRRLDHSVRT